MCLDPLVEDRHDSLVATSIGQRARVGDLLVGIDDTVRIGAGLQQDPHGTGMSLASGIVQRRTLALVLRIHQVRMLPEQRLHLGRVTA